MYTCTVETLPPFCNCSLPSSFTCNKSNKTKDNVLSITNSSDIYASYYFYIEWYFISILSQNVRI